jgi:aspartate aminotransferase-like enzyme
MKIPTFVSGEAADLIKSVGHQWRYVNHKKLANSVTQLLVATKLRLTLEEVERHPWIVEHCAPPQEST